MAGFEVNISLDVDAFLARIIDWSDQVKIQNRAGALEAGEFLKELVQANLSLFPHPFSEPTEAPAFKGPVGLITDPDLPGGRGKGGALHESVTVEEMAVSGFVKVYARTKYARIQELGGWTGNHHMTFIMPRPYFRPMVEELDTTGPGGMEHIFYDRWKRAQELALAF